MDISSGLLDTMEIIANDKLKRYPLTIVHTGCIITSVNSDGTYGVTVKGKNYNLTLYIQREIVVNDIVVVVEPNQQMSQAFIL